MPALPIRKTLAEVMEGIQKAFGKKVWEMPTDEFVRKIEQQQHRGFYLSKGYSEAEVAKKLADTQSMLQAQGGVKPGFHFTKFRGGEMFYYGTATGEVAGYGTMAGGLRGEIMVAKAFRGKGEQGIAHRISRQMFMTGAVESATLSVPGARAYHKQVMALAEEAGLPTARAGATSTELHANMKDAAVMVKRAQAQGTPHRVARSVRGDRGSRRGPMGGNG